MTSTTLGAFAEWDVLSTPVVETTVLAAAARWDVEGAPAAVTLAALAKWNVLGLTTLAASAEWNVTSIDPVTLSASAEWAVKGLVTLAASAEWDIERRPADVDALCQLNGINLDLVEFDPGGKPKVYDRIEHYDGSIGLHNMRDDIYERRLRIKLHDSTPSGLDAQEAAIKAACNAGGTFVWQSKGPGGALGTVQIDNFAPSDAPSFVKDKTREALYRSYADLVLRIWPS